MNVILGPTSTGKTSLAIKLCQKYDGEIVSADSRQIYKEMDIGTGKLPIQMDSEKIKKGNFFWDIDNIRIWGYDIINPDEYFSAYNYAEFAIKKINDIEKRGKKAFLVGGSGFYIDAVTGRRVLSGVKPDKEKREALEKTPTKNLLDKLFRMNSKRYAEIDKSNRRRIVRALEIELSQEQKNINLILINKSVKYFGLTADRKILYHKADKWIDAIWNDGLLVETENLIKRYPSSDKLNGIVYKSVVAFLKGQNEKQDAKQKAKYDLHKYIRRQLTYLKVNKDIQWFDISKDDHLCLLNNSDFK